MPTPSEQLEDHYAEHPVTPAEFHTHRCAQCGRTFSHDGVGRAVVRDAQGNPTDGAYRAAHTCRSCGTYCAPLVQPPHLTLPLEDWRAIDEYYRGLPWPERNRSNSILLHRLILIERTVRENAPQQNETAAAALRRVAAKAVDSTSFIERQALFGILAVMFVDSFLDARTPALRVTWKLLHRASGLFVYGTYRLSSDV